MQKLNKPINFDNWTERASSAGKLNTNPAGKTPMERYIQCLSDIKKLEAKDKLIASQIKSLEELRTELPTLKSRKDDILFGKTTISHLNEVYWRERTGTTKHIYSSYMENGTLGEPEGIKLVSELDDPDLFEMGEYLYSKSTVPRQFGSHFQGECDIHHSPTIQDIKCAWDIDTYYPHINELLFKKELDENGRPISRWDWDGKSWVLNSDCIENNDYECQGIVYMELYGMSEFWLRYCLVNMPQDLLDQQIKSILWEFGKDDAAAAPSIEEFKKNHHFSNLPLNLRVTTFKIKRDNVKYLDLCRRVEKAREYLNWYSQEMFWLENPGMKPMPMPESIKLEPVISDVVKLDIKTLPNSENIVSEQFKPIEDQIQEEDRIREDLGENAEKILTEIRHEAIEMIGVETNTDELSFDEKVLKIETLDIEPDEILENVNVSEFEESLGELKSLAEVYKVLSETETKSEASSFPKVLDTTQPTTDEFELKILALKHLDELNEFYMEHADIIDDSKYETIFYAHRETLSNAPEAPKITKAKVKIDEPSKEVVHPSTYIVKDGLGVALSNEFPYEYAKIFVLSKITTDLDKISKLTDPTKIRTGMRDAITILYQSNKPLIDRFLDEYSEVTKKRYDKVIEDQRKAIEEMVKKM